MSRLLKRTIESELRKIGLFWDVRVTIHFVNRLVERNIDAIDATRVLRHALSTYRLEMINRTFVIDYGHRFRIVGIFDNYQYVILTVYAEHERHKRYPNDVLRINLI